MTERMSSADVAFLYREKRSSPQHVGGLAIFTPPADGFDYDRLIKLVQERISLAPRYRQKVRSVPGHIANPMWVDDPHFDITFHVRRSALPRPGTDQHLLDFCARIQSRRLDRSHPLWEIYLVEGLSGGRIAIVTKTHEAMIGDGGIDLSEVILDAAPAPRRTVEAPWLPGPEPSPAQLLRDAVLGIVRRPVSVTEAVRATAHDVETTASRLNTLVGGVATAAYALLRRRPESPLHIELGEQRRIAIARTSLADYRQVRADLGGTVNDVMLAVVAGALRDWLLARAEPLRPTSSIRALVPVSVLTADAGESAKTVRPLLVDLPVGEPDPLLRLAQIRFAMASHKASGLAVGAESLASLSGFAPPTLHALGARAANGLTSRMFSLVVTNVPGPQFPLYAAGTRMDEMFPILPLSEGQAISVAVTSYDGGVYYGLNGDRDAMRDIALFARLVEKSLAELVAAARATARPAVGVGRRRTARRTIASTDHSHPEDHQ